MLRYARTLSVLLLSLLILTACATTTTTQPTPAPGTTVPKKPVSITVNLEGEPSTLDGHELLGNERTIFAMMYDKLVEFDENGILQPQLATKWSVSADGKIWTFDIRPGVKFWDGTPVNADAVKRSFQRLLDPANKFPRASLLNMVTNISSEGETVVKFTTKDPFGAFPNQLGNTSASILSADHAAKVGLAGAKLTPMGSGPFKFVNWARGDHIMVEKVSGHFNSDTNNVDKIKLTFRNEDTSRALGLETGEIDFVTNLSPVEANRLKSNPKLTVYNRPLSRMMGILPNATKKPFNDPKVRLAMAYAIDKNALVNQFLFGYGKIADSPLPAGVWPYKALTPIPFDVAKAKQLLTEAGYPNGFSAQMDVPVGNYLASEQIGQGIVAMLGAAGIKITMTTRESASWLSELRTKGPVDLSYYGWGNQTGDADYSLRTNFATELFAPKCCNRGFYSNPQVDAYLNQGLTSVDAQVRQTAYEKANEILWNEQAWIFLFSHNASVVGNKRVTGMRILPTEWLNVRHVTVTE